MDKRQIAVIQSNLDEHAALQRIALLDAAAPVSVEQAVYYPYRRFAVSCSLPALFSTQDLTMHCLVDARRGIAATTEPFETTQESVQPGDVLDDSLSPEVAQTAAQRFMTHAVSRRTRTIASFGVELLPGGLVYKRFWLVQGGQQRFVVDSVTGQLHDIRRAA